MRTTWNKRERVCRNRRNNGKRQNGGKLHNPKSGGRRGKPVRLSNQVTVRPLVDRDLTLFLWQRERRDGFVYLIHNAICFCQRDDDSLIVHHVLNGEIASAPIFEPLFQHLI